MVPGNVFPFALLGKGLNIARLSNDTSTRW
jgi:hypothetical protein